MKRDTVLKYLNIYRKQQIEAFLCQLPLAAYFFHPRLEQAIYKNKLIA